MTAVLGQNTMMMRQLIHCCHNAQASFRLAADATHEAALKRLFEIYAQQRARFAAELREFIPFESEEEGASGSCAQEAQDLPESERLRSCVSANERVAALYRAALADRTLPTRVHFLVSAQLALMEPVHSRVSVLLEQPLKAAPARTQTISA